MIPASHIPLIRLLAERIVADLLREQTETKLSAMPKPKKQNHAACTVRPLFDRQSARIVDR